MGEATPNPSGSGSQTSPDFYMELVDNGEYTGFGFKGDLNNPALRLQLRNNYWQIAQQLSGKCLYISVELAKTEEDAQCIIFKMCNYAIKCGKMDHKIAATTTIVARQEGYSSYWMHIVDSDLSKKLGITLQIMKIASEQTFDTVLIRRQQVKGPMDLADLKELLLKTRMEVELELSGGK